MLIGQHMRRGVDVKAIFQALGEKVAWCRVAFGEDPMLPLVANRSEVEGDGWYPDYPGGDWGA